MSIMVNYCVIATTYSVIAINYFVNCDYYG